MQQMPQSVVALYEQKHHELEFLCAMVCSVCEYEILDVGVASTLKISIILINALLYENTFCFCWRLMGT